MLPSQKLVGLAVGYVASQCARSCQAAPVLPSGSAIVGTDHRATVAHPRAIRIAFQVLRDPAMVGGIGYYVIFFFFSGASS